MVDVWPRWPPACRQQGSAQGAEGWGAPQEQQTVWDHLGTCPTVADEYICLQIPVLCLRFGSALGWLSLLYFIRGHLSETQGLWQGDSSHHMERGVESCVSEFRLSLWVCACSDVYGWPETLAISWCHSSVEECRELRRNKKFYLEHHTIACSSCLGVSIELLSSVFSTQNQLKRNTTVRSVLLLPQTHASCRHPHLICSEFAVISIIACVFILHNA